MKANSAPANSPEYFDNADFPWTRLLEDNFEDIRAEMEQVEAGNFNDWPAGELYENEWKLYLFFAPGYRFEDQMKTCPKTMEIVNQIPGISMATFSKLPAGSSIAPHNGFSGTVLRSHLALRVPEGANQDNCALRVGKTIRSWEEGKAFVFDDMHEHEAYNRLKEDRVVLMLDFLRPWHKRTSTLGYLRQRFMPHPHYKRAYAKSIESAVNQGQKVY